MLAILVALREEMRPLERRVTKRKPGRAGTVRYQHAILGETPVLLARTGIGKEHATRVTSSLLEHARPDLVLATGFAGSLDPDFSCGDFILAQEVVEGCLGERASKGTPRSYSPCPKLLARLTEATHNEDSPLADSVRAGRILTVEQALALPADKRAAGQRYAAQAVDMETSAILECTARANVPTVCARVILDDVDDQLPFDFGKMLTPTGRIRPLGAAGEIARNPRGLLQLEVLRRRTTVAAARLGEIVPAMVAAMAD